MKRIQTSFNTISVIALLALTVGCSTTSSTQNKESMLVAAGFKVITPKTAAQQQKLQQLPPGHVAMVNKNGRTYYIFPDAAHNQAYVGVRLAVAVVVGLGGLWANTDGIPETQKSSM
jgi:hypothetical protein